jgi:hypothetical protein
LIIPFLNEKINDYIKLITVFDKDVSKEKKTIKEFQKQENFTKIETKVRRFSNNDCKIIIFTPKDVKKPETNKIVVNLVQKKKKKIN